LTAKFSTLQFEVQRMVDNGIRQMGELAEADPSALGQE